MHTFARVCAAAPSVIRRPLLAAAGAAVLGCALLAGAPALAQNAAVVNGKPIPKARVDEFVEALAAQGRPDSPQLRELVREDLIDREIFFVDPEIAGAQFSPDGRFITFLKPFNGTRNIWVKAVDAPFDQVCPSSTGVSSASSHAPP